MSREDWKYLWLLMKDIAGREQKTVICIVIMRTIEAITPYVGIVGIGILLDLIHAGKSLNEMMLCAFLIALLTFLCSVIHSRMWESFYQKQDYTKDLESREMNRKSLSMDFEYLEDPQVQELRTRAFAKSYYGIRGWFLLVAGGMFQYVISIITGTGILLYRIMQESHYDSTDSGIKTVFSMNQLIFWSLLLLLFSGIMVFVNCLINIYFTRKSRDHHNLLTGYYNKKNYIREMLAGVESQKDLRINGQQLTIDQMMETLGRELQRGDQQENSYMVIRTVFGRVITGTITFLIYGYMAVLAYNGMISIGNVVIFASSIIELIHSLTVFFGGIGNMKQSSYYARDYIQFLNLGKRKHEGTIPLEKRRDNRFQVDFEHVSFRYPGTNQDVIHDLNLSFVIGEKMAIVGKNGSGKTTFIKLLCRLYDVTEGCIKVNGIDIRKYDYTEYCNLFAVVFQDFCMFAFPLGENIAGNTQVETERAVKALERVGLGERLRMLPEGLSTCVGKEFQENGVAFSGGEKQKMAIARAIYKDAPFVIMDEPTAALDPEAECEVYAGFDQMVGKKTALYISHRLASCRFCQDILVFDEGRVVQRGSHEELKKQAGIYQELWNAQAQYYR